MPRRTKLNLNPPLPEEGPGENVRNAWALLVPLIEEPTLYDADDAMQMIKAAVIRLEAASKQLGG